MKKFKKRSRKRFKILNVFSLYSIDLAHKDYVDFCRMKFMLHHSFRFVNLSNLFRAIEYDNWRKTYNHCRAHHDHSSDSFEMFFDSINARSNIESLKADNVNQDVQHETFLKKRCTHHDDVSIKFEIDLKKRSLNTQYDWLEKKEYSFDTKQMKNFVDITRRVKNLTVILKILKKVDDISIFNVKQRCVFNRVLSCEFI